MEEFGLIFSPHERMFLEHVVDLLEDIFVLVDTLNACEREWNQR